MHLRPFCFHLNINAAHGAVGSAQLGSSHFPSTTSSCQLTVWCSGAWVLARGTEQSSESQDDDVHDDPHHYNVCVLRVCVRAYVRSCNRAANSQAGVGGEGREGARAIHLDSLGMFLAAAEGPGTFTPTPRPPPPPPALRDARAAITPPRSRL